MLDSLFKVIRHITGGDHLDNAASDAHLVEALGTRGILAVILGVYWGNPEFKEHIDAAIQIILPALGGN